MAGRASGRRWPRQPPGKTEATGDTELHPRVWAWDRDAATAIGQRIGDGVRTRWQAKGDDRGTLWLLDGATRSWAAAAVGAGPPYKTSQAGPRRLFDEIQDAYQWWQAQGEPTVADWEISVGPHGQRIELHPAPVRMTA